MIQLPNMYKCALQNLEIHYYIYVAKMSNLHVITFSIAFSLTFSLCLATLDEDGLDEIKLIKSRLWNSKMPQRRKSPFLKVPKILKKASVDGSFVDINYDETAKRGYAPLREHVIRLNILSQSYHLNQRGNKWYKNEALKNNIVRGYEYLAYVAPDNKDRNWWAHKIGLPLDLYPGMVLMEDQLSRDLESALLNRYWVKGRVWYEKDKNGSNAGSNFAYRAYLGLFYFNIQNMHVSHVIILR